LLLGFGGIVSHRATEPGQAITRLAVEPPTTRLCAVTMVIEFPLLY